MTPPEGTGEGTGTGAGTGEKPAWVAQLPADLKDNESFTQYKTIGDLAKAHLEVSGKVKDLDGLQAKLKDSIPKLKADAKPEEREAYYKALGRPDKPEEYEFKGENLDPKSIEWARQAFFENGLSKDVANKIAAGFNDFQKAQVEALKANVKAETAAAEAKLKTDLGDKFEATKELASRFWKKHFAENAEALKFLETPTVEGMLLGNNPYFISLFAKAASLTGEDTSSPGSPSQAGKKEGLQGFYDKSPDMFKPKE